MKKTVPVESAAVFIDEKIKELGDWRGKTLAKVRGIIHAADPEIVEERKWAKATSPGVPVRSHGGIVCTGETYVQIGTGFLRSPEAGMPSAYVDRLAATEAHETRITRAFSGRPGRSAATAYVRAASAPDAPPSAPYPIQRGLTRAMRDVAQGSNDADRMQLWAGQSAKLARAEPAGSICERLWEEAGRLLP